MSGDLKIWSSCIDKLIFSEEKLSISADFETLNEPPVSQSRPGTELLVTNVNESVVLLVIVTSPLLSVNWTSSMSVPLPSFIPLITTMSPTENPWAVAVTVTLLLLLEISETVLGSLLGTAKPSSAVSIASNTFGSLFTNVCLSGLIVRTGVIKSS